MPSQSSCAGTQCLHAVGCAEAGAIYARVTAIDDRETRYRLGRGHLRLDWRGRAPAKASSGNRSTRRACASCRSSIWSRTTATRSRFPWTCRRRAATSRASSRAIRACACSAATAPTTSPATARCARPSTHARERQRPGARARHRHPAVLALALRRREAVQDAGEREAEARRDPLAAHAAVPEDGRTGHR